MRVNQNHSIQIKSKDPEVAFGIKKRIVNWARGSGLEQTAASLGPDHKTLYVAGTVPRGIIDRALEHYSRCDLRVQYAS